MKNGKPESDISDFSLKATSGAFLISGGRAVDGGSGGVGWSESGEVGGLYIQVSYAAGSLWNLLALLKISIAVE